MSDLHVEGMDVASNVVETIVSIAATSVEGVASVGTATASGIRSLFSAKPNTQGIAIDVEDDEKLLISVRIVARYGYALPDVAAEVRSAIVDAVFTQVGASVGSVDVFVDGIQFDK